MAASLLVYKKEWVIVIFSKLIFMIVAVLFFEIVELYCGLLSHSHFFW